MEKFERTDKILTWDGVENDLYNSDPVRPNLNMDFRTSKGREIYVLKSTDISRIDGQFTTVPVAYICIAYCTQVPRDEKELDLYSNPDGNIAVAYTVWATGWAKGAGRRIIFKIFEVMKDKKNVNRLVTLSPKTEMAKRFHEKNGAELVSENEESYNFEYKI